MTGYAPFFGELLSSESRESVQEARPAFALALLLLRRIGRRDLGQVLAAFQLQRGPRGVAHLLALGVVRYVDAAHGYQR